MAQVIRTGQVPIIAHRSQGVDLDKGGGKLRVLHMLDPYWSNWLADKYELHSLGTPLEDWEHGFWRGRRREEAILVPIVAGARLEEKEISYFESLHDMANAFASTSKPAFARTITQEVEAAHHHFFISRMINASVTLGTADGKESSSLRRFNLKPDGGKL